MGRGWPRSPYQETRHEHRREDEKERHPCAENAPEHVQAPVHEQGHDEEVEKDDDAHRPHGRKDGARLGLAPEIPSKHCAREERSDNEMDPKSS